MDKVQIHSQYIMVDLLRLDEENLVDSNDLKSMHFATTYYQLYKKYELICIVSRIRQDHKGHLGKMEKGIDHYCTSFYQ
mgnify:CR=1 FL=1